MPQLAAMIPAMASAAGAGGAGAAAGGAAAGGAAGAAGAASAAGAAAKAVPAAAAAAAPAAQAAPTAMAGMGGMGSGGFMNMVAEYGKSKWDTNLYAFKDMRSVGSKLVQGDLAGVQADIARAYEPGKGMNWGKLSDPEALRYNKDDREFWQQVLLEQQRRLGTSG